MRAACVEHDPPRTRRIGTAWACVAVLAAGAVIAACAPERAAITPTPRIAATAACIGDLVYVIGGAVRGADGDTTVASVEVYDAEARTWFAGAPMSTPRAFAASAVAGGKICVFGGLDAEGSALASVEEYDPRSGAWSACPDMWAPRSRAAAVHDWPAGILVAGGVDASDATVSTVWIYKPAERKWRLWPPLHAARHGAGLIAADDGTEHLFAIGGFDDAGARRDVEMFGVGLVHLPRRNGRLVNPPATVHNPDGTVEVLDHDYQGYDWRPSVPLARPRGFFGLATIGRRAFVVGGREQQPPPTESLAVDAPEKGWTTGAALPIDLCRFSLVAWHGKLLALGGETALGRDVNADIFEYDPLADAWTTR